jgi:selenocysteine-specific elongation factor
VAIGLGRVEASDVERGSLIVSGEEMPETGRVETRLGWFSKEGPKKNLEVALHFGTTRVPALMIPLGSAGSSAGELWARFRLSEKFPLRVGDRFIVRTFGEERTLGTGQVVDPNPSTLSHRKTLERLPVWEDSPAGWIAYQNKKSGMVELEQAVWTPYGEAVLRDCLSHLGFAEIAPRVFLEKKTWEDVCAKAEASLAAHHARQGTEMGETAWRAALLGISEPLFVRCRDELLRAGTIVREGKGFWLKRIERVSDPKEIERRRKIRLALPHFGENAFSLREMEAQVPASKSSLFALAKSGELVALPDECFMASPAFEKHKARVIAYLREKGQAATSELREHLGISRKNAVLVLERLDRDRLTYLKDNVRRLFRP